MKKSLILLLLVIAVLGISGCSSKNVSNEAGAADKKEESVETKPVSEAQLKSLKNGMSTEEVIRKIGEPLKKEDKETSEWWYYDLKKEDRIIQLTITFMDNEIFAWMTGSKDD